MPDNLCIQPDCLQMPAIVVDIEYVIAVCNAWEVLYSARLFTMPAIPVYIESAIAVYKCLAISVLSPIVYKCQQFRYTLSM